MRERCRQARQWLSARLDGELSERRRARLDQHLQACEPCRRFGARLAELSEAFPAPVGDPGRAFTQRVMDRLAVRAEDLRALRLRFALAAAVSLSVGLWLGLEVAPQEAARTDEMTAVVQATFNVLPDDSVAGWYLTAGRGQER